MEWRKKRNVDEPYCAVHNVDCSLHDHDGDTWVLCINPMMVPSSWICPEAVKEIARFEHQVEEKINENQTGDAAGLSLTHHERSVLKRCLREEGWQELYDIVDQRGEEFLTLEQLDGCQYALGEWNDDDEVIALRSKVQDHWERNQ